MMHASKDNKQQRLHNVALFAGADKNALHNLAEAVEDTRVEAGTVLITEGIHHTQSFVIDRGIATIEVGGRTVTELTDGDFVGELAYLAMKPATATVRAKTDLELMLIPHNRLDQVLANDPQLVRAMATELANRLAATNMLLS